MELKIYIAGKVTGEEPFQCKYKFDTMEVRLRKAGIRTVINPLKLGIPPGYSHEEEMAVCMKVIKNNANTLVMLNDWISSDGAKEEYNYAAKHDYNIFFEDEVEEQIALARSKMNWIDTSDIEFP